MKTHFVQAMLFQGSKLLLFILGNRENSARGTGRGGRGNRGRGSGNSRRNGRGNTLISGRDFGIDKSKGGVVGKYTIQFS